MVQTEVTASFEFIAPTARVERISFDLIWKLISFSVADGLPKCFHCPPVN
jgi:hypothetical protein